MENNLTRQYGPPTPVSSATAAHARQPMPRNVNNGVSGSSPSINLPDTHDLSNIRTDLESLLPHTEARLMDLRQDLSQLERSVKIRDTGSGDKPGSSGKNVNAILEKMRVKQESSLSDDAASDILHSSSKSDRQAALETLKRRRRREDNGSSDEPLTSRSESPYPLTKMKKLDSSLPNISRSVSPPPLHGNRNSPKISDNKKKKSGAAAKGNKGKHPKPKTSHKKTSQANDVDFVRVKPKDQVPVTSFWQAVEPYFRPLTEDDRKFLLELGDNVTPYLIPPLGRPYHDIWADEDKGILGSPTTHVSATNSPTSVNTPNGPNARASDVDGTDVSSAPPLPPPKAHYLQPGEIITDDYLLTEDLTCGTLTERLLSSLVLEDLMDPSALSMLKEEAAAGEDDMDLDGSSISDGQSEGRTIMELSGDPTSEVVDFEERLKRELRYAGLFTDDDIDWNAREDDELCAEMRTLHRELREQVKTNDFRKKRLLEVVDQQLQYEQYRHVLDTYDAQVEQCYMKRFRTQKSKKRKAGSGPKATLSENAVHAMEKRKAWIEALEPIFKSKNFVMPSKSIYQVEEDEPSKENSDTSQSPSQSQQSQPQQTQQQLQEQQENPPSSTRSPSQIA